MSEFKEEVMLECLEQSPPNIAPLLPSLGVLFEEDPDTARSHTKLIRLQLKEKEAYNQLILLYGALSDWHARDPKWRQTVVHDLRDAFEADPLRTRFLELSGIDSPRVKPQEALRRLEMLCELAEGDYVFMKNFGFGTVKELRVEDDRVVVDFVDRLGHEIALGFAAEKLERVGEDHLYARRHLDPEGMQDLIKSSPGEVVRIALRSFGPTSAPVLQSILVPDILPEAKWKTFWTNARKELKQDPLVVLPSKRSEPIELLAREKSFDEAWFRKLKQLKNMTEVLDELEAFLEAEDRPELDDDMRGIVADRLKFVALGARGRQYDCLVRAWLIARELDIPADEIDLSDFLETVTTSHGLLTVVEMLSAQFTKALLRSLADLDAEKAAEVLLDVLPSLEYSALNEAISLLTELGKEDRVASALRDVWNQWSAEVDVMFWLSQNSTKITEWNYGTTPDLVARILKVINRDYAGNRLRVRNQLRDVFRKPSWLKGVLSSMDERQRRALTQGVKDSSAWEQLDKASVLGQLVKLDASLQDIVSGRSEGADEPVTVVPRVSSIRSYREKEALLQKIVQKDIPENTKDIARAREYGDLRENFEYKAAKDLQRVLMGRRGELENQLRQVKPTDFSEFTAEEGGIATSLTIQFADGVTQTYHILGEWDSDPQRHIISNSSAMAKALTGSKEGDRVQVPTEEGEREATVTAVKDLDSEIRAWVMAGEELPRG